jgi:hypothetical protein
MDNTTQINCNPTREDLIANIKCVYDENNNIIKYKKLHTYFAISKYSSKKNAIWHLEMILNDDSRIRITKRHKYKIEHHCYTCKSKHIIGTTHFLRKINKLSIYCNFCVNSLDDKREKQSLTLHKTLQFKNNNIKVIKPNKVIKTNLDKIQESIELFNQMDDDFKDNYFNYNLTHEEFDRMKKNIVAFQNGKIKMNDNIEYIPIFKCNNQICFTSMMYDRENDILFKTNQPILYCNNCNTEWRAKSLERHKNKYIIKCKECSFACNSFKLRKFHNINKQTVNYQSKPELKFINFCNNNGIIVNNGPKIKYVFNNSDRQHTVDFEILIDGKKYMIEIKDNHIWHKNEMKNGKWNAKETAARSLIDNKNYFGYYMIFPKNWVMMTRKIKNKTL